MSTGVHGRSIGVGLGRLDGVPKVRGTAPYAYEQPVPQPAYLHAVQATVAKGTVVRIDTGAAEALDGVLAVLTHLNAPRLVDTKDQELLVLQSAAVGFRGQVIGAVVAESAEIARHAAGLVGVEYAPVPHDSAFSFGKHAQIFPEYAIDFPRQVSEAEIEVTLAAAPVAVDQTYTTPPEYNVPMEPHTSVARMAASLPCTSRLRAFITSGRPWRRCSAWSRNRFGSSPRMSAADLAQRSRFTPRPS